MVTCGYAQNNRSVISHKLNIKGVKLVKENRRKFKIDKNIFINKAVEKLLANGSMKKWTQI